VDGIGLSEGSSDRNEYTNSIVIRRIIADFSHCRVLKEFLALLGPCDGILNPTNWDFISGHAQVEGGESNKAENESGALGEFPFPTALCDERCLLGVSVDLRLKRKGSH